jgi:hypothetical protein
MQKPLPQVRIVTADDEEEVVAMCKRLHEENGLFSLSETRVRECIRRCINAQGTIVAVIGPPGGIEGSICMEMTSFYYTDDLHLSELWNFVDEQHRRSRNAEALIEFGKACALKMQMPFFTGIITNRRLAGKVRLYRRLLGNPVGAYFIFNANWATHPEPMFDHTELRKELKASATKCASGKVRSTADMQKLSTLLSETADTLGHVDNLWGKSTKGDGGALNHM